MGCDISWDYIGSHGIPHGVSHGIRIILRDMPLVPMELLMGYAYPHGTPPWNLIGLRMGLPIGYSMVLLFVVFSMRILSYLLCESNAPRDTLWDFPWDFPWVATVHPTAMTWDFPSDVPNRCAEVPWTTVLRT